MPARLTVGPAQVALPRLLPAVPTVRAERAVQGAGPSAAASRAGASADGRRRQHSSRTAARRRARRRRAARRQVSPGRSPGSGRPSSPPRRTPGGPPSRRPATTRPARRDRAAACPAHGGSGAGSWPCLIRPRATAAADRHPYIVRSSRHGPRHGPRLAGSHATWPSAAAGHDGSGAAQHACRPCPVQAFPPRDPEIRGASPRQASARPEQGTYLPS